MVFSRVPLRSKSMSESLKIAKKALLEDAGLDEAFLGRAVFTSLTLLHDDRHRDLHRRLDVSGQHAIRARH